jgi:hypothetical protein
MVRQDRQGLDPQMKETAQETYFKNYKKVQGLLTPMKMETLSDGAKSLEMEFTSVELLEKVDEKEFDVAD